MMERLRRTASRHVVITFFVIMCGIIAFLLYSNKTQKERAHFSEQLSNLDIAYRASVRMYRLAMDGLFANRINQPDVLDLVARAEDATPSERNLIRGKLYRRLEPAYRSMQAQNLRQMHFHLADGSSFLRFYLPDRYGDTPTDDRPLILLSNASHNVLFGFEIGRTTGGFRYVYPLWSQGRFLGSVEMVMTSKAIRDAMAELDPSREFLFLLSRPLADRLLLPEQRELYADATLHPGYLVEANNENLENSPPSLSEAVSSLNNKLRTSQSVQNAMAQGLSVATSAETNGVSYSIVILPLKDVKGHISGYIVSYAPDPVVKNFTVEFYLFLSGSLIALALISILLARLRERSQALKSEQSRKTAMFNALAEGAYVQDDQGVITEVNPAASHILGYSYDEFIGQSAHELLHRHEDNDCLPREQCPFYLKIHAGEPYDSTETFRHKDGRLLLVEVASRPILKEGEATYSISAFHDVTHRMEIERELRESEELQRSVMESLPIGMVIIDPKTRVIEQVNSAAAFMFGAPPEAICGHRCHQFLCPANEYACPIGDLGQTVDNSDRLMIRADGSEIPVLKTVTVISLRGEPKYLECLVDISARKDAEDNLIKVNKELELAIAKAERLAEKAAAASTAKSNFLANMSHEIRTPLNGVISMLNLLEETRLTNEQHEFLNMAGTSAESLLAVINDILDFSKIEAGHLELLSQPFDLELETHRLMALFASRANEKDLELLERFDPAAPRTVVGDKLRLRQVLSNLLSNAIKFTEYGHVFLDVQKIFLDEARLGLRFVVEDTGIGIPEEKLGDIFDQFTQVDESAARRFGGTGLGLAICRHLVEMMGGTLQVKSTYGEGTTFFFDITLPLGEEKRERSAELPFLHGIRILVVDPSPINRRICSDLFNTWGVAHDLTDGVSSAWKQIEASLESASTYDCVLLDHSPGHLSDFDFIKAFQQDARFLQTRIILIASLGVHEEAPWIDHPGVCTVLTKPFSASDLYNALRSCIAEIADHEEWTGVGEQDAGMAFLDSQDAPRLQVLLVDDHPINRKAGSLLLTRLGCDVTMADNGAKALELVRERSFDMVFMDVQMPVMDGFEATRAIRRLGGRFSSLPIIALTANALEGDKERCLRAGMTDYLCKPMQKQDLVELLENYKKQPGVNGEHAGASPVGQRSVFDPDALVARYENDLDMARELLALFREETPGEIQKLHHAIKCHDAEADTVAHRLKSPCAYITAYRMEQLCKEVMHAVGSARWDQAEMLYDELSLAWKDFEKASSDWLEAPSTL
ncbi:hypothetical protein JCM15519_20890 [Fundidesulfovibrio butyratiphilus]